MDIYQKTISARQIASKKYEDEAKNTSKSFKSLLAASNRQVQLCRNNKGTGLEAKQLLQIEWHLKTVCLELYVVGRLITDSLVAMHEDVSTRKFSASSPLPVVITSHRHCQSIHTLTHLNETLLVKSASIPYSYHNLCDPCIPRHPAHATYRLTKQNANLPRGHAREQKKNTNDGSASELPSMHDWNESEQRGYGKNASERS